MIRGIPPLAVEVGVVLPVHPSAATAARKQAKWRSSFMAGSSEPSVNQCRFSFLALAPAADILLKLWPKLLDGVLYRPGSAVSQAADRGPGDDADGTGDFVQNLQVLHSAAGAAHALHHSQHPASPFAARRTLAARFVRKKAAAIVEHIDDA